MSHTLHEVQQIAFHLPEDEPIELANSLLESVWSNPEVDEAWKAEVERRIDDLEAGKSTTHSWEQVEARIRTRQVK